MRRVVYFPKHVLDKPNINAVLVLGGYDSGAILIAAAVSTEKNRARKNYRQGLRLAFLFVEIKLLNHDFFISKSQNLTSRPQMFWKDTWDVREVPIKIPGSSPVNRK